MIYWYIYSKQIVINNTLYLNQVVSAQLLKICKTAPEKGNNSDINDIITIFQVKWGFFSNDFLKLCAFPL